MRPGAARHARVPVLMYHVISAPPAGTPYPQLWVGPAAFAAQMTRLEATGYTGVTLKRVYDAWHGRGNLPRRPVVVSFDDGYESQHRSALPVLRRLGWPGVLNLKLNALDVKGGLRSSEVEDLIRAGWEIDSHTFTHPDLPTLGPSRLRREVEASRAEIRRRFGVPADFFCYPAGRYDAASEAAVRRTGYLGATTTEPGLAGPERPFELRRLRVVRGESAGGVTQQMRTAR